MRVSRSEVSALVSIQRESFVTGAKAISASLSGSGWYTALLRMKRSRAGPAWMPGSSGFQTVAGETLPASATLRGPVRRSSIAAIEVRQLFAAISRSAALIVTCASFSASTKVLMETSGPTAGRAPKVGGAPGVAGGGVCAAAGFALPAEAKANNPHGGLCKKLRPGFHGSLFRKGRPLEKKEAGPSL